MVYPALLPLMRTPRLPVVDWTDAPTDLNGLVRFAERRNLVSARVPSHFKRSLRHYVVRQVSSAVQESLRRLGVSWNTATQLEKWTTEEVRGVILFLWMQKAKPVNIHRQVVAVYGTNVIPVEQIRKWHECHGRRQKWPSTSNPTHYTALLALPRDFKVFERRKKKIRVRGWQFLCDDAVQAKTQKWLRERLLRPGLLKVLSYRMTGVWISLVTVWKNEGLVSKHNHVRYLSPFIYFHLN